jgi:hypothetical protein
MSNDDPNSPREIMKALNWAGICAMTEETRNEMWPWITSADADWRTKSRFYERLHERFPEIDIANVAIDKVFQMVLADEHFVLGYIDRMQLLGPMRAAVQAMIAIKRDDVDAFQQLTPGLLSPLQAATIALGALKCLRWLWSHKDYREEACRFTMQKAVLQLYEEVVMADDKLEDDDLLMGVQSVKLITERIPCEEIVSKWYIYWALRNKTRLPIPEAMVHLLHALALDRQKGDMDEVMRTQACTLWFWLRKQLWIVKKEDLLAFEQLRPAGLFALIVAVCDKFLMESDFFRGYCASPDCPACAQFAREQDVLFGQSDGFRKRTNVARFMTIVKQLPMELQMTVAHRTYGSRGELVRTDEFDAMWKALV